MSQELIQDEINSRLTRLADFLHKQSAFTGDNESWAADCIKSYLDGTEKTLDYAFGLRSSKRGPKPMVYGAHDDWVVAAWSDVISETPEDEDWPNTGVLADIGRYYGLGGKNNPDAEDHGIASELKRILNRYRRIIVKQLSDELTTRMVGE